MGSRRGLTVGMPPLSYPPLFTFDAAAVSWTGFLPELLHQLERQMGDVTFEMVPIIPPRSEAELVRQMVSGSEDIDVASMTPGILSGINASEVLLTTSLKETTISGLVSRRRTPPSHFQLFDPLQSSLWLAIVVSIMLTAFCMVVVDAIWPVRERSATGSARRTLRGHGLVLLRCTYQAWAAMLGGEDADWPTVPARILRLGLLFMVLIVNATYTANLAAFFNRPGFQLGGPSSPAELSTAAACILYESLIPSLAPHVGSVIAPPEPMAIEVEPRLQWCHARLRDGTADIMLYDRPILSEYLFTHGGDGHCDTLADAPWVSLLPDIWAFSVKATNKQLLRELSTALVTVKNSPRHMALRRDFFYVGRTCGDIAEAGETDPVALDSMWGLFIIAAAFAGMAVLAAILQRLAHQRQAADASRSPGERGSQTREVAVVKQPNGGDDDDDDDDDGAAFRTDSELLHEILNKQRALAAMVARMEAAAAQQPGSRLSLPPMADAQIIDAQAVMTSASSQSRPAHSEEATRPWVDGASLRSTCANDSDAPAGHNGSQRAQGPCDDRMTLEVHTAHLDLPTSQSAGAKDGWLTEDTIAASFTPLSNGGRDKSAWV